jgi:hypothetical protein
MDSEERKKDMIRFCHYRKAMHIYTQSTNVQTFPFFSQFTFIMKGYIKMKELQHKCAKRKKEPKPDQVIKHVISFMAQK